jgi:hypothetical protein
MKVCSLILGADADYNIDHVKVTLVCCTVEDNSGECHTS